MPTTKTIFILGIEGKELILSDGGETCARQSDRIVWEIASGSGVGDIADIKKKDDSDNVFDEKEQPARENGTKKWKGKIKDEVKEKITEDYTIYYKKTGDQVNIYEYDPKISVNPS